MANEILYSGHSGLFNAAAVTPLAHALLSDNTDLRSLCEYKGSINGTGSSVIEVPRYNAFQAMADTSEGADAANQDVVTSSATITVARKSIVREPSHLFMMAGNGAVDVPKLAQTVATNASNKFTDMLCSLFSSVTAVKGTSGATFTYDAFLEAQSALSLAGVPANGVFAVMHQKQVNELRDSYRAETGIEAYRPQADEILKYKGFGYVFNLNGIDVFSCDSVLSDGTDYIGCMFGYGAFAYADGLPNELMLSNAAMAATMPDDAAVWVTAVPNHRKDTLEVIGNYYVGVSLIEDARAVRLRSID